MATMAIHPERAACKRHDDQSRADADHDNRQRVQADVGNGGETQAQSEKDDADAQHGCREEGQWRDLARQARPGVAEGDAADDCGHHGAQRNALAREPGCARVVCKPAAECRAREHRGDRHQPRTHHS
jgi:hypothetical protein